MIFYILLAIFAIFGAGYSIYEELRWRIHLADMAKEIRERGNG